MNSSISFSVNSHFSLWKSNSNAPPPKNTTNKNPIKVIGSLL
nr:MAG TPA: hypothetical protein [Caudoviricetes sp.]DAV97053.1 MAG TPA: hypothetical protein [Caudoviricetes sp.]